MAAPLLRRDDDDDGSVIVSEPVLAAVERAGARARGTGASVTDADIAVSAGIGVDEARRELLSLARLVGGELEVSSKGDILYSFEPGVRGALSAASGRARRREAWKVWKPRLAKVVRLGFGAALISSLLVVTTAITVLATASSSSDNDQRNGGSRGRTVYVSNSLSPFDIWYYSQRPPALPASGGQRRMNFLEACFSFVFGDGDPNAELEQTRWRLVGQLIREQGGAVTAEQLAPLLEPEGVPAADGTADGGGVNVDESFVLPALTHFSGVPTVVSDEGGNARLIYTFPELTTTAGGEGSDNLASAVRDGALAEQPIPFSTAEPDQLVGVGALGVANLGAVLYLGRLLQVVRAAGGAAALAGSSAGLYTAVSAIFPLLGAYAAFFVAAPLLRSVALKKANDARERRNALRAQWSKALAMRTPQLARKLKAARAAAPELRRIASAAANGRSLGGDRTSGRTLTASDPSAQGGDDAFARFDERLGRRQRALDGQQPPSKQ